MYISEVIQTIAVTYCYMLLLAFYNQHHVTSIGMSWAIGRALETRRALVKDSKLGFALSENEHFVEILTR